MKQKLTHGRNLIRLVTFVLAAFAILGGVIAVKCRETMIYRSNIENNYQHSLEELYSGIANISVSLEKAVYAQSPAQMSKISSDILKDATIAKSYLSLLPSGGKSLDNINRFLSQVGDYSAALSQKLISSGQINSAERSSITNLLTSANALESAIWSVLAIYQEGGMWTDEASAMLASAETKDIFGDSMKQTEDTFTSYPSLLYDGPFSDHILQSTPKLTAGKSEISREYAMEIAAKFLQTDKSGLSFDGAEEGKIPAYRFSGKDFTISVSRAGGYVTYYRKYRSIGQDSISFNDAVAKATEYATRFADEKFSDSYYFADEGMCTVNLAYVQGNTVCYTDLVKVGVAMDNGEMLLFESTGYIMNHSPRTISPPVNTIAQALAVLSDKLQVISTKEVLIPSPGTLEEYHCYEFYCVGENDRELLVYIDTETLAERDIQLLLRTDGGTMTK